MGSISLSEDASASATANIPIIDLSPFTSPSPSSDTSASSSARLKASQDLVRALRDVGFAYIKNHGVPQDELDAAFALSKRFFDLPLEQKMKAPHPPGWSVHRGYSWPGLEKVSSAMATGDGGGDEDEVRRLREVKDFKESYEVGSETNPDQPNVWPPADVLPEWRPFMSEFYWTCFGAAKHMLRALALGIGFPADDEDHLLRFHDGHHNQLRLLHYPPVDAAAVQEGAVARMPAHTDWSSMTMLFQDDCGGLQVEHPAGSGEFVDVPPLPGTCVVNVGDLLMRWSNDFLTSTAHRVQLPPLQRWEDDGANNGLMMTRPRYSIPYFLTTDPDTVIECLRVDDDHPPKYDPITQREYAAMRARMQY
ncbi:uncharacterized protein Z520_08940 [Fonsecaea multimorphosa CBS 102226]|uniref:Fe2OG dioxygenase domain-containing protein n=1 Tax=Fonsecaea multimorphosa CBS 102226 TaxID=1442371 RepID=A0A0D2KFI7_9EURO|nr:uncharacterized protein Z520_08940 [Fonsecaea multimorphosa CBS 102226]KIX95423.1 hypothetical protein Z520_08940 [Fonsecaea multimorphosa CBS 102226]OAL20955.1 hypothetical protein AYO22_08375 [Fonsecaea multimorphosa]